MYDYIFYEIFRKLIVNLKNYNNIIDNSLIKLCT